MSLPNNSGSSYAAFSFSLTFTKPGPYEWCLIHADVGQGATIILE